jgi:hypothetical protein
MELNIPHSLKLEHEELHAKLAKATRVGGRIADAAQAVAAVLHPHFEKEEEFALPPVGLLSILAGGGVEPEMAEVLAMTNRLKAELSEMLDEHQSIVGALKDFVGVTEEEHKPEYGRVTERLILHAQTEEQVLYPASLLIGDYVKLKLKK